MPMFDPLKSFRFWCHKVIPLVYDDSLSYYEFLCKVMKKLNEVIDLLNAHSQEIERFEADITAQFNQLRAEFEAFRTEIRQKIDAFEALFVENFSTEKSYLEGDYVLYNDALWRASFPITPGDFDEANWEEVVFANDFADWRREMNARVTAFISQITSLVEHWISMLASPYRQDKQYQADDIAIVEGTLYVCTGATSGSFDPTKWETVVLADWVTDNIRRMDEAIDSIGDELDTANMDKADITDCDIISKDTWSYAFSYDGFTTVYGVQYNVNNNLNWLVYVVSPKTNNQDHIDEFFNRFTKVNILAAQQSEPWLEITPIRIGNSCFITVYPISLTNFEVDFVFSEPLSRAYTVQLSRYEVNANGQKALPPLTGEYGYGFVDVNNIAKDVVKTRETLQNEVTEVDTISKNLSNTMARAVLKDVFAYQDPNANSVTAVESFDSTSIVTIDNVQYAVASLSAENSAVLDNINGGFVTFESEVTNPICGTGSTPFEAFANQITFRQITIPNLGTWYVPTYRVDSFEEGERIWFFTVATVPGTTSIKGVAYVSRDISYFNSQQGNFIDLPYRQGMTWLDGRASRLEAQLGGKSVVDTTQAQYDALATKDANTVYLIVG